MSTRAQDADRQITGLLGAEVRRDDLYMDQGVSDARASRPGFDKALEALQEGDTLMITTLDRLGRSTANMLDLAKPGNGGDPPLHRLLSLTDATPAPGEAVPFL